MPITITHTTITMDPMVIRTPTIHTATMDITLLAIMVTTAIHTVILTATVIMVTVVTHMATGTATVMATATGATMEGIRIEDTVLAGAAVIRSAGRTDI